ncbi:MAG: Fe-S cluster assembly protein SufD [Acidobacteriota bacterium]
MATELLEQAKSYQHVLRAIHESQVGSGAPWFDRLRGSAMERFAELGFPSVKDEEWKYTNVAPIARMHFNPPTPSDAVVTDDRALIDLGIVEARESQLVFLNGILRDDLSSMTALPEEVVAIDLSQAIADPRYGELVWKHLAQEADYVADGFVALNTALMSHGAFVYIPKGVEVKVPLHLLFISDGVQAASFPRVLLIAEENSRAVLVESYISTREAQYFTNSAVEVVLKDGARLEHYKIQRESIEAFHIATTAADLGAGASYDATSITFGAELSRHDVNVRMDHEGAECWVDGLYIVTTGQHADTHSLIDHRKPHCTSHQLYKGILDGKSRAVFNGKIFVRHDAQKTDAMQTNKNLLLSNEARVDTKPQLEILADDVKCAHGAAVGQIDEDELFYLATRGIHPDLARNLLTYGFAEEVIGKIKIDSIRAQLDKAVLNRLNARLEA